MEPVTHFLTGACIGRAGFNRKTAYATLAAVLAAEAADLDMLLDLRGPGRRPEAPSRHHAYFLGSSRGGGGGGGRGVDARSMAHSTRARKSARTTSVSPRTNRVECSQSIHWGWLYLTACVAALSHLLLDWTNNYGVRPFFPFNPRWYAGSFMFIAEPVMWALLFLALFMPWVLGLADREIGARKQRFRGRGWAIFALVGMLVLGCWRWAEHAQALVMVGSTPISTEPALRMAAEPYHGESLPLARDRRDAESLPDRGDQHPHRLDRQRSAPRCDCTSRPTLPPSRPPSKRRWAACISIGERGPWCATWDRNQRRAWNLPICRPGRTWTTVEFTDLRFDYSFLATRGAIPGTAGQAPLSGWVYIVDGHEDAGEAMNGREQR